jgi:recombination protein RecT
MRAELARLAPELLPVLPPHITPEKFMRVVQTSLQKNMEPGGRVPLLEAERKSFFEACMECAADGLLPDGREGAFTIMRAKLPDGSYVNRVKYIPMIAGLKKKVQQSGLFAYWKASVIYENDAYNIQDGDEPRIKHTPLLDGERGRMIAVYSVAKPKDNSEPSRHWMPIKAVNAIRDRSRAKDFGPWRTDEEEMTKKTCMRQHSKDLPLTEDLRRVVERDDALYDLSMSHSEARRHAAQAALPRPTLADVAALPSPTRRQAIQPAPEVASGEAVGGPEIDLQRVTDAPLSISGPDGGKA